jgi:hypothetical protein
MVGLLASAAEAGIGTAVVSGCARRVVATAAYVDADAATKRSEGTS